MGCYTPKSEAHSHWKMNYPTPPLKNEASFWEVIPRKNRKLLLISVFHFFLFAIWLPHGQHWTVIEGTGSLTRCYSLCHHEDHREPCNKFLIERPPYFAHVLAKVHVRNFKEPSSPTHVLHTCRKPWLSSATVISTFLLSKSLPSFNLAFTLVTLPFLHVLLLHKNSVEWQQYLSSMWFSPVGWSHLHLLKFFPINTMLSKASQRQDISGILFGRQIALQFWWNLGEAAPSFWRASYFFL